MQCFNQKRHRDHRRRVRGLHITDNVLKPLADDNRSADCHRIQEADRRFVGVMQRQHRKEPIVRRQMHIRRHRVDIGCQITVADHNALGRGSRAAGKNQHRERVRIDLLVHQARITEVGKDLALLA